jgi:hypothetical protein
MALSPSLRCSTRLPRALGPLLDARLGSSVDIQTLYREHAAKYEKEFLEDMTQLGIRPVDVMTRVSEYLPEVVSMVRAHHWQRLRLRRRGQRLL